MALECSLSGRSVDGLLDLPRQFRRDLTCKEHDECDILPVGLGGSATKLIWRDFLQITHSSLPCTVGHYGF